MLTPGGSMTINSRRAAHLAAICAAAAVAVPATASAAPGASIVGGPLKVKDYSMTVVASDGAQDSLSVMFTRQAGKATQTHFYTFADGVNVTASRIKGSLQGRLLAPGHAQGDVQARRRRDLLQDDLEEVAEGSDL